MKKPYDLIIYPKVKYGSIQIKSRNNSIDLKIACSTVIRIHSVEIKISIVNILFITYLIVINHCFS